MLPGNLQHHHNVASHINSKDFFPAASTTCRLVKESSVATAAHQTEAIDACGSLYSAMPGCTDDRGTPKCCSGAAELPAAKSVRLWAGKVVAAPTITASWERTRS